ncbi:hypothetical protein ACLOJK_000372 [Asimina triloba]
MSLVDYASDEDSDIAAEEEEEERKDDNQDSEQVKDDDKIENASYQIQSSRSSLHHQSGEALPPPTLSIERLPDASLLLNSPSLPSHNVSGGDHYSRVAAAMAENSSRKREANGSMVPHPRSKHPRGNLPHSHLLPDTLGGQLVPPQLNGRLQLALANSDVVPSVLRGAENPMPMEFPLEHVCITGGTLL